MAKEKEVLASEKEEGIEEEFRGRGSKGREWRSRRQRSVLGAEPMMKFTKARGLVLMQRRMPLEWIHPTKLQFQH